MIEVRVRENIPHDGIDIFVRMQTEGGFRRHLHMTERGFEWSEPDPAMVMRPTLTLDDAAGRALLEELMRHYAGAQDLHTVRSDLLHERGRVDGLISVVSELAQVMARPRASITMNQSRGVGGGGGGS